MVQWKCFLVFVVIRFFLWQNEWKRHNKNKNVHKRFSFIKKRYIMPKEVAENHQSKSRDLDFEIQNPLPRYYVVFLWVPLLSKKRKKKKKRKKREREREKRKKRNMKFCVILFVTYFHLFFLILLFSPVLFIHSFPPCFFSVSLVHTPLCSSDPCI